MKQIKTFEQANAALHRIAEIESALQAKAAERDSIVNDTNRAYAEYAADLEKENSCLIELLHAYTDQNREVIIPEGKKSVELPNGVLGYRQQPDKIEVNEKTADLLIAAGLNALVKIKKEPVKAALKNMSETELVKYEAKRIPGQESFFVSANEIRQDDTRPAA